MVSIDIPMTKLLDRSQKRTEMTIHLTKKEKKTQNLKRSTVFTVENTSDIEAEQAQVTATADAYDPEFAVHSRLRSKPHMQMRQRLKETAKTADRFAVSSAAAAAIASSAHEDFGIIKGGDTRSIIDQSKMKRERKKTRVETTQLQRSSEGSLLAPYFDGKKNETIYCEKEDGSRKRKSLVEHISLVSEPGSKYIGHVTSSSGSAVDICSSILSYFHENGYDLRKIKVIGADGTSVNTGHIGGVNTLIEKHLGHSLQWQICLLHFNELLLRHLITHLDGSTTGPASFSGPIGNKVKTCEQKTMVKFKKIVVDLPDINPECLSTDQKYLLEMCQAICSGIVPDNLANRDPGALCHVRWLTAANRILRLYVSERNPSKNLRILAEYIMRVYAKVWFMIKKNW